MLAWARVRLVLACHAASKEVRPSAGLGLGAETLATAFPIGGRMDGRRHRCGIALYYLSAFILFVIGFSFYAVTAGLLLAVALWLVGAPLCYARLRKRGPQVKRRLLPFLAGMLIFPAASCLEVLLYTPQTIMPR
jgi:hypothetical protein